jgi:hypothetical protein
VLKCRSDIALSVVFLFSQLLTALSGAKLYSAYVQFFPPFNSDLLINLIPTHFSIMDSVIPSLPKYSYFAQSLLAADDSQHRVGLCA